MSNFSSELFDILEDKSNGRTQFMPLKTRVLVVDDSALMRGLLTEMINSAPDMEVVGAAPDAPAAREMIKALNPDVITLDVQMPKMDGLEFLERLMRLRPMPVVMVSAYTEAGSETTLRALELGAIDFIGKPRADGARTMEHYAEDLVEKLRAARGARLRKQVVINPGISALPNTMAPVTPLPRATGFRKIIFLGASTGGTEAIKEFLMGMSADCPPILIVQHMPEAFTASFARRLDSLCAPRVIEAKGNEKVEAGTVYIAPGHSHLQIKRAAAGSYVTELLATPPVNRHRPSVEVLFDSAASLVGNQAVGVILTGMGKDGAQGMLRMRQAGARTFGQDEASCVVYGMPREAFLVGAVDEQCPLDDMANRVMAYISK
jgi:two-component system, chemotaxis family, protein-glutamate methylesterase/glutaminase